MSTRSGALWLAFAVSAAVVLTPWHAIAEWRPEDERQLQELLRRKAAENRPARKQAATPAPSKPVEQAALAGEDKKDPLDLGKCPSDGPIFVLRQNLKDLSGFPGASSRVAGAAGVGAGCPSSFAKANGASIAYSHDRVAANRSVTAQGLGGILFNGQPDYINPPDRLHLAGWSFGGYGSANTLYNSNKNKTSSNTRVYTYGAVALLTIAPPGDEGWFSNIRLSAGGVTDDIKKKASFNATFAYNPTYAPLYLNAPFPRNLAFPVFFLFDPMPLVQYDVASGANTVLLFNDRKHALRLGGQLKFGMYPNLSHAYFAEGQSTFADFASRMSATVAYHPYYEAISRRSNYFLETAVQYRLDRAGHFALKASYQHGRDEDMGAKTNVYLLSLTGKL